MSDVPIPENKPQPDVPDNAVLPPAASTLAKDGLIPSGLQPSNSWDAMLKHLAPNAGLVDEHHGTPTK